MVNLRDVPVIERYWFRAYGSLSTTIGIRAKLRTTILIALVTQFEVKWDSNTSSVPKQSKKLAIIININITVVKGDFCCQLHAFLQSQA